MAALDRNDAVAFSMPGGEVAETAKARPIDLAHLARQTMDDRDLERQVLEMFVEQALTVRDRIAIVSTKERLSLAHALKGAASGVGAMAIARCAEAIENSPEDSLILKRLARLIDEARDFIAAINR